MKKNHFLFFLILFNSLFPTFAQVNEERNEEDEIQYEGKILDTAAIRGFAPTVDYSAEVNLRGLFSLGEQLPFWMYKDQRGRIAPDANYAGWITGKALRYIAPYAFLEAGAGILYRDGSGETLVPDELYVHFENRWFQATAGRKQKESFYRGLSASNENILWSTNARPLPGIQLATTKPIYLFGDRGPGFEASWSEYLMGRDRIYKNVRLHHKSFHLLYKTQSDWTFKAGVQHFTPWGGKSRGSGAPRPQGIRDYLDVILVQYSANDDLSSYEINIRKKFSTFELELLYDHIAVDRTGRHLKNTPDGRYGIFYATQDKHKLINAAIYEFYYTHHQSYNVPNTIPDNYFNPGVYGSGWVYKDFIIGAPFFHYDREEQRVINNKFSAHHLGIAGQLSRGLNTYPYEFLISYSHNDGVYTRRYRPQQNIIATYLDLRVINTFAEINLQLATELNNTASPLFGAALHLKYKL